MPFGPALAIGVVITFPAWSRIAPACQYAFFQPEIVIATALFSCVLLVLAAFTVRLLRLLLRLVHPEEQQES
jgi:hypothetical protein